MNTLNTGDGATICYYSDRTACTVIRKSSSGKTVWLQVDKAHKGDWQPEFVPGGFSGHCINNEDQTYTHEPDLNGAIYRASYRKNGKLYVSNTNNPVIIGRHHFHDYNF